MIDKYITGDGRDVYISKLDNRELLKLYKYFMDYTRKIREVIKSSEEVKRDKTYMAFADDMTAIKEAMKEEIKHRSLRIGKPK